MIALIGRTLFSFLSMCLFFISFSQSGKVLEQEIIKSKILGKDVRYTMYLPPDYYTSQRSYPIVYLLHGFTDDNTGWLQYGEINRYADKAIGNGMIPPMIIAMPNGDSSFYVNSLLKRVRYWIDCGDNDFLTTGNARLHIALVKKLFRMNTG